MPDLSLDLRYLRCAIAAAQTGSFRRAAEILNLPQSTISRRIQLLERRLGFQLFERRRTGVRSTAAGEAFLHNAVTGAQLIDTAAKAATSVHRGIHGELRVGVSPVRTRRLLRETLQPFKAKFPNIFVSLIEGSAEDIQHSVAIGDIDIAFVIGANELSLCRSKLLWREAVFIGLPKSHKLASRNEVKWDEIRNEIFLTCNGGSGPDIRDYLLIKLGGTDFAPVIEIHTISEAGIFDMVSAGYGITLSCNSAAHWWPNGVTFRPVTGEEEALSSSAIWLAHNLNPALANIHAMIDAEQARASE